MFDGFDRAGHSAIGLLNAQKQIRAPQRFIHDAGKVVFRFRQIEVQLFKVGRIRSVEIEHGVNGAHVVLRQNAAVVVGSGGKSS